MIVGTPFLVVDEQRLRGNIQRAAAWAGARGVVLRPHVKTHKSPRIADLQLAAGAVGITVATLGEAEVFAEAGFADIFVGYPLWLDEGRRARAARLAARVTLRLGCDSAEALARLAGVGASVLIEIDCGHHRSGVRPKDAGLIAASALRLGISVDGVFTFPGHAYGPGRRRAAALDEAAALVAAAASLRAVGVEPAIVSGGSTPSLEYSSAGPTEFRPGVYVVNDAQQWELGSCRADQIALTCRATVVSHSRGRAVLDCGSKILGADHPAWATGYGRLLHDPDARIVLLSEHHAVVETAERPDLGSVVEVVPNHACNAINLVDELYVCGDGGEVIGSWPVAARGRNA